MDEEKPPWQVEPRDPDDLEAVGAAAASQQILNALWKDPEFRKDFWTQYRAKVREAIGNGEL